tara:strand:+ start:2917 stop:3771 length:855 start_codon:yes stop_codon:yes gene_type:complete
MSSVDYSFLEYTYNPEELPTATVEDRLTKLGFSKRTRNSEGSVVIWTQNLCILVLKVGNVPKSEITGIGFLCDRDTITRTNAQPDPDDTGMFIVDNCAGLRTLLMPQEDFNDLRKSLQHIERNSTTGNEAGLSYVSGVIYNSTNARMRDFYQDIGFRFTKTGDRYYTFLSANNRFTILMDTQNDNGKIPTIVCDTDDVFVTTANYVSSGVDLRKFDIPENLEFGQLNHKIKGYNCNASGNENSYTIENLIPDAAPNLDIIFRQRKQYLHISETTLDTYYAESEK